MRLSFLLSGGPEGILLLHHAVWAISTLAIVLALYFLVQWRFAAPGVLVYLAFLQKNLELALPISFRISPGSAHYSTTHRQPRPRSVPSRACTRRGRAAIRVIPSLC